MLEGFSGLHSRNSDAVDRELAFLTSSWMVPMLMGTTDLVQLLVIIIIIFCYRWGNETQDM